MKQRLLKGDWVKFKGDESTVKMQVRDFIWSTKADGTLRTENDKFVLESIRVGWFNDMGEYLEKDVHSNSIYKIEHSFEYYLLEAIKFANDEQKKVIKSLLV